MRVFVAGPHVGPVHTVLWSSGHHRRVKGAGWLYLLIALCGGVAWAFIAAPWIGVLVSAAVLGAIVLALYGVVAAHRQTRERMKARSKGAGWKAEHVPASAEYRAAHPEGPRDWEPSQRGAAS
jgi:hypothetical protein